MIIPWSLAPKGTKPSYHIFPVLLPDDVDRQKFMEFMKERGVQTSVHYPSFKQFSFYGARVNTPLPVADVISRRAVTLPLYPGMSASDIAYIAESIRAFSQQKEEASDERAGRRCAL